MLSRNLSSKVVIREGAGNAVQREDPLRLQFGEENAGVQQNAQVHAEIGLVGDEFGTVGPGDCERDLDAVSHRHREFPLNEIHHPGRRGQVVVSGIFCDSSRRMYLQEPLSIQLSKEPPEPITLATGTSSWAANW